MRSWAAGLLIYPFLVGAGEAEPIKPQHVPNGTKWVIHLDVDAARKSKMGQHFRENRMKEERVQRGMEFLKERYGIDAQRDFHGMTVFGNSFRPHQGVVVLYADYEMDKVLKVIRDEPGYRTEESGDHTLHVWEQKHRHRHQQGDEHEPEKLEVAAAFPKDTVAVMGRTAKAVTEVLALIEGDGKPLDQDSPLIEDLPAGPLFYGAAIDLKGLGDRAKRFPILTQHRAVRLFVLEDGADTRMAATLVGESEAVAEKMVELLEGLRALGQLRAKADEGAKLLQAIEIEDDDEIVDVEWSAPTRDVIEAGERMRELRKKHRHRHKHRSEEGADDNRI